MDMRSGSAEVSVVIPAWGRYVDLYLDAAIASAMASSAEIVDVVVVDNAHDPPIERDGVRVVRLEERVSVGAARNRGLAEVTTEYVIFLDADDRLLAGSTDRMLELSRAKPQVHPTTVSASLIDPETGNPYHWPYRWMRELSVRKHLFAVIETWCPSFPVNGSLLRSEAVRSTSGFDSHGDAAEDWCLGVSLAWRGPVVVPAFATMTYAPSPGGMWAGKDNIRAHMQHRRYVRRRLLSDSGIPLWARMLYPIFLFLHLSDVGRKAVKSGLQRWPLAHSRPSRG